MQKYLIQVLATLGLGLGLTQTLGLIIRLSMSMMKFFFLVWKESPFSALCRLPLPGGLADTSHFIFGLTSRKAIQSAAEEIAVLI